YILITFFFLLSSISAADLTKFYVEFKTGNYQGALDELAKLPPEDAFEANRSYLMALCLKNMQKHDKAVVHFKAAIRRGKKSEDLFFEYGQSLFAINELVDARRAFRISFEKGYKPDFSLYYIAHIGEILEDSGAVKKNYVKLIKDPRTEKPLKQVAYFRLAELIYERTKGKVYANNYIADYVVPLLDKAEEVDPKSETASEIRSRYDEILLKHNMHPLLVDNGRMLSRQAPTLIFTQNISQDDNVTLQSDAPAQTSTNTDTSSSILQSELFYSKRFISGRYFVFTPEIRLSWTDYGNDANTEVTQNNSYGISPAARGSYNFSWNKKKVELLLELESNYTARDKDQTGTRSFFGRSLTYTLGLRRKFIQQGDTTIKLRQKNLTSYTDAISGPTSTLYVDQLYVRENGHIIVGLFISDFYRPNDEQNATNSYLFRADYLMPRLFYGVDLNLNSSITFLDTRLQSDTRGTESTTSFGFKIQRRFDKRWRVGFNYTRTQNLSAD
ncbi:unnamed protein product, partial [Chrysoparadoxa australica]